MRKEKVLARMGLVMTKDEIKRIRVSETESGDVSVQVDLHELSKSKARRFIGNIFGIIRGPFRLDVIHGYNHGTVLKEYINNELDNKRIKERHVHSRNEGMTILNVI